jgi:hypothetical protein
MKSTLRSVFDSILLAAVVTTACTSPKKKSEEVSAAVSALRNSYSPVQDMEIVVSGGINLFQYSQRLTDALLKFKNSEDNCKQAATKFADQSQQALAAEVCQHLGTALDAYILAKEYFGSKYDELAEMEDDTLGQDEYAKVKERFPDLEELPVALTNESGYKFYARSAMLQALWRMASRERQTAKSQIDQLSQM